MKKIIINLKRFVRLTLLYTKTRIFFLIYGRPNVLTSIASIKQINKNNLSVARFGDGEFMIIKETSLKFQDYNKGLAKRLEEILYSNNTSLAICIPSIYKFKITRSLKYEEEYFWLNQIIGYPDIYLDKKFKNNIYFDSCLTRPYIRYKKTKNSELLFNEIKKIWQDKDLLIVEGKYSRLGVGNDLFDNAKSLKRIICPNKNAYDYYDDILKNTIKFAKKRLVLIALGPTATVLAYDLNINNIRAIDLGHLDLEYEWFLNKSTEKEPVKNKIVNEVETTSELSEINDKKYLESIICEIK